MKLYTWFGSRSENHKSFVFFYHHIITKRGYHFKGWILVDPEKDMDEVEYTSDFQILDPIKLTESQPKSDQKRRAQKIMVSDVFTKIEAEE